MHTMTLNWPGFADHRYMQVHNKVCSRSVVK